MILKIKGCKFIYAIYMVTKVYLEEILEINKSKYN